MEVQLRLLKEERASPTGSLPQSVVLSKDGKQLSDPKTNVPDGDLYSCALCIGAFTAWGDAALQQGYLSEAGGTLVTANACFVGDANELERPIDRASNIPIG